MYSTDEFAHLVAQRAQKQIGDIRSWALGHVSSYDRQTHQVRVIYSVYRDEDDEQPYIESDWMPLGTPWVGDEYGVQVALQGGATVDNPTGGESCLVVWLDGIAVCATLFHSPIDNTPSNTALLGSGDGVEIQPGEIWIRHSSGSNFKMLNDGNVVVTAAENLFLNGHDIVISCHDFFVQANSTAHIHATESATLEAEQDVNIVGSTGLIQINEELNINTFALNAVSTDKVFIEGKEMRVRGIDLFTIHGDQTINIGSTPTGDAYPTAQNINGFCTNTLTFQGNNRAKLLGEIVDCGGELSPDLKARTVNIAARSGNPGGNNINLNSTGNGAKITAKGDETYIEGITKCETYSGLAKMRFDSVADGIVTLTGNVMSLGYSLTQTINMLGINLNIGASSSAQFVTITATNTFLASGTQFATMSSPGTSTVSGTTLAQLTSSTSAHVIGTAEARLEATTGLGAIVKGNVATLWATAGTATIWGNGAIVAITPGQTPLRLCHESLISLYNTHTHTCPAGTSQPPSQLGDANYLTSTLTAR